ncbi:MAG: hypothetical protein ACRC2T_05005 [Thermoguttaceae bacterium]
MKKKLNRRGVALYLVAAVVAILSLGALALVSLLVTERQATRIRGNEIQVYESAQSGVELVRSVVGMSKTAQNQLGGLFDNPKYFAAVEVVPADSATKTGAYRFTVLAPKISGNKVIGTRYGLVNESTKLHLQSVLDWELASPGQGRRSLMALPGMTPSTADSILDWIDSDSTPRSSGAELAYYRKTGAPYGPRNAIPVSLDELLLVRDMTRPLLYANDDSFNFGLKFAGKANQSSSSVSASPLSSATSESMLGGGGTATPGLPTITDPFTNQPDFSITPVISEEIPGYSDSIKANPFSSQIESETQLGQGIGSEQSAVGQSSSLFADPLADLSGSDNIPFQEEINAGISGTAGSASPTAGSPAGLLDESEFFGPPGLPEFADVSGNLNGTSASFGAGLPWVHLLTTQSAEKEVDPSGTPKFYLNDPNLKNLHGQIEKITDTKTADFVILYRQNGPSAVPVPVVSTNVDNGQSSVNFAIPAKFELETPLDLIDVSVVGYGPSPFSTTSSNRQSKNTFFRLLDYATTSPDVVITGRVNINEAPYEVLCAVPGISSDLASQIVRRRNSLTTSGAGTQQLRQPVWLLDEKLVDLPTLKTLWNKITSGGDVYSCQVVGFIDNQGTVSRCEVVIDGTVIPPRQVFFKDLTVYGRGFPESVLKPK